MSTVFVRYYFIADKLVYENTSPNGKYSVRVILVDQGALGGDIKVNLDKKYFNIFKKERTIYNDRYWEEGSYIRWIDDNYIDINGTIIDIQSKCKVDKRL
ncbi:DUF5412 family protein [Clostridium lundense]|uniref:DUF5412 family protein n=1 Tax=Clostridium lundense TaxID=319475 RepID=UPI00146FBDE8